MGAGIVSFFAKSASSSSGGSSKKGNGDSSRDNNQPDPNKPRVLLERNNCQLRSSKPRIPSTETPYEYIKNLLLMNRTEFFKDFARKPVHEKADALEGLVDKLKENICYTDLVKKNLDFILDYNRLVNKLQSDELFDLVDVEKLIKLEPTIIAYRVFLPELDLDKAHNRANKYLLERYNAGSKDFEWIEENLRKGVLEVMI